MAERGERLIAFIARAFSPRNLTHAFKSVLGGFREYAAFFAALLIVQSFFWAVLIGADSKKATRAAEADANCTYDAAVSGLTSDEWSVIYNNVFLVKDNLEPSVRGYESYEVTEYYSPLGAHLFDLRLILTNPAHYQAFFEENKITGENAVLRVSESVQRLTDAKSTAALTAVLMIAASVLSVAILTILFLIRSNHYKFTYGIYMSFGAGFEKLFLTAAYELFAIGLLTFLPGLGLSLGVSALILRGTGGTLAFSVGYVPLGLLWMIVIILLSVAPAVRILTAQSPISMIVASDNANLVSSPRRSFRIFRKKFPLHYELFGFWRFRSYYAALLASAVLFTTLFLSGLFISEMAESTGDFVKPQFILSAGSEPLEEADAGAILYDCPNVGGLTWEASTDASDVRSHIVLTRRQSAGISGKTVDSQIKGMKADNNFKYFCAEPELTENAVENGLWKVEGDLDSIFTQANTVALTESVSNQRMLNFKVGDTVRIAKYVDFTQTYNQARDRKSLLKKEVRYCVFDYVELTVGAVVDTGDTDDSYSLICSPDLYRELTGMTPTISAYNVFLKDPTDHDGAEELYNSLLVIASYYDGGKVESTYNDYDKSVGRKLEPKLPILILSSTMLIVSAIVWLIAQSNFSKKREEENFILSAMGARDTDLKRLYLISGAFLAAAASMATALLASLLNYLTYRLINNVLISWKFIKDVRYEYSFSWLGLLVCVLISAACAAISTYLPVVRYIKDRDKKFAAELNSGKKE